jgi:cytochrome c oxidase subunit 2
MGAPGDVDALHIAAFWICVIIAIIVFGAMIYSLVKFHQSRDAVAGADMLHGTKADLLWTIISFLILVAVAIPAAELILKMEH